MALVFSRLLNTYKTFVKALATKGLVIITGSRAADTDPTISAGSASPSENEPIGSIYLKTDGTFFRKTGSTGSDWTAGGGTASASTGITASTGAAGTGNTGSATTGITVTTSESAADWTWLKYDGSDQPIIDAAGSVLTAQSADFDKAFADLAQPTIPRTIKAVFDASWDGGNIELTGLAVDGSTSESLADPGGSGTVESAKAWIILTRARNVGTRTAGSVELRSGDKIGLPVGGAAPTLVKVYETTAGGDITTGSSLSSAGILTFKSGEEPNGAKEYIVAWTEAKTYTSSVTDSGHTHTGPSHTHAVTVSDSGHSH